MNEPERKEYRHAANYARQFKYEIQPAYTVNRRSERSDKEYDYCKNLLNDFENRNGIEIIKPVYTTNNIDDPKLLQYFSGCPAIKKELIDKIEGNYKNIDEFQLGELSKEQTKELINQHKNDNHSKFKIFEVNYDNSGDNQFIITYRTYKPRTRLTIDVIQDNFSLINLNKCKIVKDISFNSYKNKSELEKEPNFRGLLKYKNEYIFYVVVYTDEFFDDGIKFTSFISFDKKSYNLGYKEKKL